MGTPLWSEVNAELQNVFDTKVFVEKHKKELLQKCSWMNYGIFAEPAHPPTHLTSTSCILKKSSKLVILLSNCP